MRNHFGTDLLARCALIAALGGIAGCQQDGIITPQAGADGGSSQRDAAGMGGDAGDRDADTGDAGDIEQVDGGGATMDSGMTASVFALFLAPDGDDQRDGLSPATAVRTLKRAHALIKVAAPTVGVEVRIAPGTYRGQQVNWTYTLADNEIRFVRSDPSLPRPVFDGCLVDVPTDPATQCPGGTWFQLSQSDGKEANLSFRYLEVRRYQTAISFNGNRNSEGMSNGSNRIYGCIFRTIGNSFRPALAPSTAAVRLVNSDDNDISNNHFVDVINASSCGLIHALYIAHMSDRNIIRSNRFFTSCGDPIRLRDYSNDNVIRDNKVIRAGVTAAYTEWYCDHDVRDDCTKVGPECPSWNNEFRNNLLDGNYACEPLSVFHYFQDDTTTGCAPPTAASKRLSTSGNTKTAVPCTN